MNLPLEIISLHEASHAIIAQLFCDCFSIEAITLNPGESFGHLPASKDWAAVNQIEFLPGDEPTAFSMDALMMVNWAGFIGQNIGLKGVEVIASERKNLVCNPNDYNTALFKDDYGVIRNYTPFQAKYRRIDEYLYECSCRHFLLNYFLDAGAWKYVEAFSDALLKAKDQTMDSKAIQSTFDQTGYSDFLREKRVEFLSGFFKLTGEQRKVYAGAERVV